MDNKIFPQDKWKRLISDERDKVLNRKKFFEVAQPNSKETWADIGCGPGFFTLPLAERVKLVYAVDVSENMLNVCKSRAEAEALQNIKFVKADSNSFNLPNEYFDRALLVTVFHEFDNPQAAVEQIRKILKSDGMAFIIDWKVIETEFGPPLNHRIPEEKLIRLFANGGFELAQKWSLYEFYYALAFKKL